MAEETLVLKVDSSGVDKGKKSLDQLVDSSKRAEDAASKLSTQSKQASDSTRTLSSSTDMLVNSLRIAAGAFATLKLTEFIKETATLNQRYQELGIVLDVVAKNAGLSAREVNKVAEAVKGSGISMIESRQIVARLVQANIDLSKATELATIAQGAAVIGQIDSSEALDRMIHGITAMQTEILRGININVDFQKSYDELAKELGVTTKELTTQQEMQARVNAVLKEGENNNGIYAAAMANAGKQVRSTTRLVSDLKVKIGGLFDQSAKQAVSIYTDTLKQLDVSIDEITKSGELEDWSHRIAIEFAGLADVTRVFTGQLGILYNLISTQLGNIKSGNFQNLTLAFEQADKALVELYKDGQKYQDQVNQRVVVEDMLTKAVDRETIITKNNKAQDEHNKLIQEGIELEKKYIDPKIKLQKEEEKLKQLIDANAITQAVYTRALKEKRNEYELEIESINGAKKATNELNKAQSIALRIEGEYIKLLEIERKQREDLIEPYRKNAKQASDRLISIDDEINALKLSRDNQISLQRAVELTTIAKLEENKASIKDPKILEQINLEIAARKKISDLIPIQEKLLESTKKATSEIDQLWIQTGRNIQSTLANSIFDFFTGGLNSMVANVKNAVLRIMSEFAALKLAQSIGLSAMFAIPGAAAASGAGTLANAASGASGISNALNIGSMGGNLLSIGSSAFNTGLGATSLAGSAISGIGRLSGSANVSAFGSGLGGDAIGGLASGGFTSGAANAASMGSAFASVAGPAIALAAVDMLGRALAGDKKLGGAEMIPVIGGFMAALFGRGPYKFRQQSLQGEASSEGFTGDVTDVFRSKGGLFVGNKHKSVTNELPPELEQLIDSTLTGFSKSIHGFAENLGYSTDAVDNFSKQIQIKSENGKHLTDDAIQEMLSGLGDDMARGVMPAVDQFKRAGETSVDTLSRISGEFDALVGASAVLGVSLNDARTAIRNAGIESGESFINAAGGVDALNSKVSYFAQNFLDGSEIVRRNSELLVEQMSELGLSTDLTKQQFKDLVQSYGQVNGVSEEMLVSLLDIAPLFNEVSTAADSMGVSIDTLAEKLMLTNREALAVGTTLANVGYSFAEIMQVLRDVPSDQIKDFVTNNGGMDALLASSNIFAQNFLVQSELMTVKADYLAKQLGDLGIRSDLTTQDFKDLVQGVGEFSGVSLETRVAATLLVDEFVELYGGTNQVTGAIGQLNEVVPGAVASIQQLVSAGLNFGLSMQTIAGLISSTTQEQLNQAITNAGGINKITQDATFIKTNFMTPKQALNIDMQDLANQLAAVGVSTQTTREQFLQLIQTAQLGSQHYNDLNAIAPLFDSVYDRIEAAAQAAANYVLPQPVVVNQDAITAAQNTLQTAENDLARAHQDLASARQREASSLQQVVDRFRQLAQTLRAASEALSLSELSPLTPQEKYSEAARQLSALQSKALSGDQSAMEQLPGAARDFLEASKIYNGQSTTAYKSDFDKVQQLLNLTAGKADAQASLAQQQLSALGQINDSTLSVAQAVRDLNAAQAARDAAARNIPAPVYNDVVATQPSVPVVPTGTVLPAVAHSSPTSTITNQQVNIVPSPKPIVIQPPNVNKSPTDKEILDFWNANINSNPRAIYDSAIKYGVSSSRLSSVVEVPQSEILEWTRSQGLAAFAQGTDLVPHDGIAMLHKGEAVTPSSTVTDIKAIKQFVEENKNVRNTSSASNKFTENSENIVNAKLINNKLTETSDNIKNIISTINKLTSNNKNVNNALSVINKLSEVNDKKSVTNLLTNNNEDIRGNKSIVTNLNNVSNRKTAINRVFDINDNIANVSSVANKSSTLNDRSIISSLIKINDDKLIAKNSLTEINDHKVKNIAAFELGTDLIPRDGLAMLHKGEAVTPASTVSEIKTIKRILEVNEKIANTNLATNRTTNNNENITSVINKLNKVNHDKSFVNRTSDINIDKSFINRLFEINENGSISKRADVEDNIKNISSITNKLFGYNDSIINTSSSINRISNDNESIDNIISTINRFAKLNNKKLVINQTTDNSEDRLIINQLAKINEDRFFTKKLTNNNETVTDDKSLINSLINSSEVITNDKSLINNMINIINDKSIINRLDKTTDRNISNIAAFSSGTDLVPKDGIAMLHKGEAITPSSTVIDIKNIKRSLEENETVKNNKSIENNLTNVKNDKSIINKLSGTNNSIKNISSVVKDYLTTAADENVTSIINRLASIDEEKYITNRFAETNDNVANTSSAINRIFTTDYKSVINKLINASEDKSTVNRSVDINDDKSVINLLNQITKNNNESSISSGINRFNKVNDEKSIISHLLKTTDNVENVNNDKSIINKLGNINNIESIINKDSKVNDRTENIISAVNKISSINDERSSISKIVDINRLNKRIENNKSIANDESIINRLTNINDDKFANITSIVSRIGKVNEENAIANRITEINDNKSIINRLSEINNHDISNFDSFTTDINHIKRATKTNNMFGGDNKEIKDASLNAPITTQSNNVLPGNVNASVAQFPSDRQIAAFWNANIVENPDVIYNAAIQYGISSQRLSDIVNVPQSDILELANNEGIPAFERGTNFVERGGLALLHPAEAVSPANHMLEMANEIKELRKELAELRKDQNRNASNAMQVTIESNRENAEMIAKANKDMSKADNWNKSLRRSASNGN